MTTELRIIRATDLTRPANATQYAAGDHVSNSTSAASADYLTFPLPRTVRSFGARKLTATKSDGADVVNAQFRLHILSALPAADIADNDPLSALTLASKEYYLGYFDFTFPAATFGNWNTVQAAPGVGDCIVMIPDDNTDPENEIRNCYAVLEAKAAYTPLSGEVFTFAIEGDAEIEES